MKRRITWLTICITFAYVWAAWAGDTLEATNAPAPNSPIGLLTLALPLISYALVAALRKFAPGTPDWLALSIGPAFGAITDYLSHGNSASLQTLQTALYAGAATWIHEISKSLRADKTGGSAPASSAVLGAPAQHPEPATAVPKPWPPPGPIPDPGLPTQYAGRGPLNVITILLATLSIAAALLVGCTTTPPATDPAGGANSNQLHRIELVATLAASTGAQLDLRRNPEHRSYYEAADAAIAALLASEDYDPAKFAAALQALPVRQLQGDTGAIIVSTAVILWDEAIASSTPADRAPIVRAFALGVHAGLKQALALTQEPGASARPPSEVGSTPAPGVGFSAPAEASYKPAPYITTNYLPVVIHEWQQAKWVVRTNYYLINTNSTERLFTVVSH